MYATANEQAQRWGEHLSIRVDEHDYEELLRQVVAMAGIRKSAAAAFRGLCKLLDQALRIIYNDSENAGSEAADRSGWHVESIGGPPTRIQDTEDKLISAVRDATKAVIKAEALPMADVVNDLEHYGWQVFGRLALYTAASFADFSLSTRLLTNRASFDCFSQEYQGLLECHFGALPPKAQAVILGWIDAGPHVEAYKSGWQHKGTVTDEEARAFADDWRYPRLLPIKEWLPPDRMQQLRQLENLHDLRTQALRDEFESRRRARIQPPDPRTADIDEIVAFLQKDTDEAVTVARDFHSRLVAAVTADPERFAEKATSFLDSTPSGLWHVLHGFDEAAKEKPDSPWESVLDLCDQALQVSARTHDDSGSGRRTTWADVRGRIASMIDAMMRERCEKVPFAFRKQVWKLIEELASDPPPDDENTDYKSYAELAMTFLGNTCGMAVHAAVGYAAWVRSNLADRWQGFNSAPETRKLFDKHLAAASRAIRAVYGESFSWLAYLDLQWARQNAEQLFPTGRGYSDPMFQAAWLPYIVCSRPHPILLDVLSRQYALALNAVSEYDPGRSGTENPHENLANQFMWLYVKGAIGLEDNGFVRRLFNNAPDDLRASALRWIGRALAHSDDFSPEEIQRIQDLWEWRLGETRRLGRPAELREFGYWFASGKLPVEWALEQLSDVLESGCPAHHDHRVTERLAETAPRLPVLTMHCLSLLLKDGTTAGWLAGSRHTRSILKHALASGDALAARAAEEEINRLLVNSLADHTDLLKDATN